MAISTELFEILWSHLFLTVGLMIPLTLFTGILVTFRVAGPVHRFEQHLKAIANGEDPGDCYIRKGDEFTELCELINSAVNTLRAQNRNTEIPANPFKGETDREAVDEREPEPTF